MDDPKRSRQSVRNRDGRPASQDEDSTPNSGEDYYGPSSLREEGDNSLPIQHRMAQYKVIDPSRDEQWSDQSFKGFPNVVAPEEADIGQAVRNLRSRTKNVEKMQLDRSINSKKMTLRLKVLTVLLFLTTVLCISLGVWVGVDQR